MRVKLQPPTKVEMAAYNPVQPPASISQVMLLANPSKVCSSLSLSPSHIYAPCNHTPSFRRRFDYAIGSVITKEVKRLRKWVKQLTFHLDFKLATRDLWQYYYDTLFLLSVCTHITVCVILFSFLVIRFHLFFFKETLMAVTRNA